MNAADITTDHGVVNNYGNITAKNISITTYSDITNEGQISSTGDLTLNTKNKGAIYNYSTSARRQHDVNRHQSGQWW